MYIYLLKNAMYQLKVINAHASYLRPDMPEAITGPLKFKRSMFIALLGFSFLAMLAEAVTQTIVVTMGHIGPALLCYEIGTAVVMGFVGYYFKPMEYSPFFFMVPMESGRGEDPQVLTMVKSVEDPDASSELDISPLLPANSANRPLPSSLASAGPFAATLRSAEGSLIVVQDLDHDIRVGVSQ